MNIYFIVSKGQYRRSYSFPTIEELICFPNCFNEYLKQLFDTHYLMSNNPVDQLDLTLSSFPCLTKFAQGQG